jgi:hypothetical protein
MIVSASYRTDIPALYGSWFLNRLDAGYARAANPYGGPPARIALTREAVDGFVFWTKNAGPFLGALDEVARRGFPFVLHHGVTGYPRELERAVPRPDRTIAIMRSLRAHFGPRALVWRYDPILFTPATEADWHLRNFGALARALSGTADEVIVSFVHPYAKTRRNLGAAGVAWRDPDDEEKRAFLRRLGAVAREQGFALTLCTQPDLVRRDLPAACCIDANRLSDVASRAIAAPTKGNRPGCLCAGARDIGAYESCTLGCAYCYAVRNNSTARNRRRDHDPAGEFLIPQATVSTRGPDAPEPSGADSSVAGGAGSALAMPTRAGRNRRSFRA